MPGRYVEAATAGERFKAFVPAPLASGAECLGVLCKAKEPEAETREREWFDDRTVFRLALERREGGEIVARVTARIPAHRVLR